MKAVAFILVALFVISHVCFAIQGLMNGLEQIISVHWLVGAILSITTIYVVVKTLGHK